jgi:hypothetical protein
MNEYQNTLKQALQRDIFIAIAFVIGIIIVGILLLRMIKSDILPKWTLVILVAGVVLLAVGSIKTINIYSDMRNESYVAYHGNYYQRHQGYEDTYYQTTLLDGEEINLLSHFTLTQNTGEYYGYVVYGSKSKIVVYIGENLPDDLSYLIE